MALIQGDPNKHYSDKKIVVFVGGVGGAKLAYGLYHTHPHENLTIVVNTGDDMWHYGLRISPDVDTLLYTLSDRVDPANGWGIANDTTNTLETLQSLGETPWFRLGDKDIATHLIRTHMLRRGERLTEVVAYLRLAQKITCSVLPMADEEIATIVGTEEYGNLDFQEYFVRYRWQPKVTSLNYLGAQTAELTPEIRQALFTADTVVIAPSNPWLSLAPILAIPALRETLQALQSRIPVVAVTPIVGGQALKGPAAKIMQELGHQVTPSVILDFYENIINAFVSDEQDAPIWHNRIQTVAMNTVMKTNDDKISFAQALLGWLALLET